VPRSYIGHWLADGVAPWIDEAASQRVLELCTGSGCLAILLARALPAASIDALDISPDALKVAARNIADYGLAERIQLIQGDLFAPVAGRRYQLIVANPPYVTQSAMRTLPAEYLHEPRNALAGGEDGFELIRRILANARGHLTPNGLLVMEVGHARSQLERAFPQMSFTWLEIDGVDDAVLLLRREQLAPRRGGR
jgi:ribosomal protein L3 glutamine methyltransferase